MKTFTNHSAEMSKKRGESRSAQGKLKMPSVAAPVLRPPQFTHTKPDDDPDFPLAWRASRAAFTLLQIASMGKLEFNPTEKFPPYFKLSLIIEADSDLATPFKEYTDAYIAARKELMAQSTERYSNDTY